MKALSIRQPWAWLIAAGIKDVENRTWKSHFQGRLYIHASSAVDPKESWQARLSIMTALMTTAEMKRIYDAEFTRGAIIGEVTMSDCCFRFGDMNDNIYSKWHEVGYYGFYLTDPVLYDKPIPCRGARKFFEPYIERWEHGTG